MVLNYEQTTHLLDNGFYTGMLLKKTFASFIDSKIISPLGKCFVFEVPLKIEGLTLPKCLVLAGELRITNAFGSACFQRFYTTQIGSLLSTLTEKDHYVEDGCIFNPETQVSFSLSNLVKNCNLFHLIFPLESGTDDIKCLALSEEKLVTFKNTLVDSFNVLLQQIFAESCNDYF